VGETVQAGELFSNRVLALLDVIHSCGLGLWELKDDVITLDEKAADIAGLEEASSLAWQDFLELVNEADRHEVRKSLGMLLASPGSNAMVDCRLFSKKQGVYVWIRILGKSYLNQGNPLLLGTGQKIEGRALEVLYASINAMRRELSRKDRLHRCIFEVTEVLLNADDTIFEEQFQTSLEIVGHTINLARVYVYKNHLVDGTRCCTEIYEWTEGVESTLGEDFTRDMPFHSWPGLEEILEASRNYNRLIKDVPPEIRQMIPAGIKTVLFVPIFLRDLLWGFVGYERTREQLYGTDEESVLASLGLLLANSVIRYDLNKNLYMAVDKINSTSIRAEELERFAYTDALTGLYNRRHFMELAQNSLEKVKRYNSPCYAMIMDLDFFKKVNDTYGHLAGDEVLKSASAVMKNTLRSYDLLARYGGEEFVVLITDTSRDDVLHLAERIRESIAATPCIYNCIKIICTVSIGVAAFFSDCTVSTLIDRADKGLYRAKELGRNQVVLYEGD
jgi:diguanylate cyclase (GGDEF)-like protein